MFAHSVFVEKTRLVKPSKIILFISNRILHFDIKYKQNKILENGFRHLDLKFFINIILKN